MLTVLELFYLGNNILYDFFESFSHIYSIQPSNLAASTNPRNSASLPMILGLRRPFAGLEIQASQLESPLQWFSFFWSLEMPRKHPQVFKA